MFDKIRSMMSLLGNLPKMREQVDGLQTRLGQIIAEGDAGAGMVKVRVNGRMEMMSCNLTDEALKTCDREMLEDLIKAAVNQAIGKARATGRRGDEQDGDWPRSTAGDAVAGIGVRRGFTTSPERKRGLNRSPRSCSALVRRSLWNHPPHHGMRAPCRGTSRSESSTV